MFNILHEKITRKTSRTITSIPAQPNEMILPIQKKKKNNAMKLKIPKRTKGNDINAHEIVENFVLEELSHLLHSF